jgi:hypothetical protein
MADPAPSQLVKRFDGLNSFEQQGISVHGAGDVNGDGVPDVVVGLYSAASAITGNHVSARVYSGSDGTVLLTISAPAQSHGSHNAVVALVDASGNHPPLVIVGTPGAKVGANGAAGVVRIYNAAGALLATKSGPAAGAQFGASIASAGDVDGDGRPDLIVGAPGADRAFVYSGDPATGFLLLATLEGPERSCFGASVGTAGDMDGDRLSEVVVGAPYFMAAGGHAGRVYVFRVATPGTPVRTVTGSGPTDLLGSAVDGGRDLNGDGVPDFMGAAPGTDITGPKGTGYVAVYSGANGAVLRTFSTGQTGDLFGFSAALHAPCAGQHPTLIAGAPQALNPFNGLRTGSVVVFDAVSGAEITRIFGSRLMDALGISVRGFADLTGDGRPEFLVGAHGMSQAPALLTNGAAFVYSCTIIPRPEVAAVPNPVDFGSVAVGATHNVVIQVNNQGSAALIVSGLALGSGSNAAFSIGGPSVPFTVPASGSQAITAQYAPTTMGVHGGVLQLQSNDPDAPTYDIALSGTGLRRAIEVIPASSPFGPVDVGETSWNSVKVKSVGNEALTVSSVAIGQGSHGDFALAAPPPLPKLLMPGQHLSVHAMFQPTGQGTRIGAIEVGSDDLTHPTVEVPLSGVSVAPNAPPTAVIKMDVPYNGNTIQLKGQDSFDPDGAIAAYQWDFGHDDEGAATTNPVHTFPCQSAEPCLFVARLTVTDNGGKSDPTSISVVAWTRELRSRFYGTIRQGSLNVPDGTVVQAWITNTKVAESLTQTHLGQSVFAIEIPPDIHHTGDGGKDGDTVVFKYRLATANETGVWYRATDQELNLTAPFYIAPGSIDWCILAHALGLEICGPSDPIFSGDVIIDLQEWPEPPIPDPGPLRRIGRAFQLTMRNARTREPIGKLQNSYEIRMCYTDRQLGDARIADRRSLRLHYAEGDRWIPAGENRVDLEGNQVVTRLTRAGTFALFGRSAS